MNPEMKIVVQEMLHVHSKLKNMVQKMLLTVQQMLLTELQKEVEADQRHEEERNPSVHNERVHEEAGTKTSKSRKSKSRSLAYSDISSGEEHLPQWAKFWINSHQNAQERLFSLENEMRNKNEANSRPTDKVEAFNFEKKVYCEQYKFNQKVAE